MRIACRTEVSTVRTLVHPSTLVALITKLLEFPVVAFTLMEVGLWQFVEVWTPVVFTVIDPLRTGFSGNVNTTERTHFQYRMTEITERSDSYSQ